MQTVFVTGAGGFTGRGLLNYLRGKGYDVVAGVRNRARKLAYEREDIAVLVCNVTDPINVARVIASVQPEGVVHLAGVSSATAAAREPLEAYQAIVTSWANLLDAVRRAVPRAHVVLASAGDVYGNAGREGMALYEDVPLEPVSTFGSLKATAESIARTFYRDYHLNVTIARPFPYTGPGQSDRSFFGELAQRLGKWDVAVHGRTLSWPDLTMRRELLHVDDVVAAYARLLADGRPNEVYNICTGEAVSRREVVEWMIEALRLGIELTDAPAEAGAAQIPVLRGENTKIRTELGWAPTRSARDAIRDLVAGRRAAAGVVA